MNRIKMKKSLLITLICTVVVLILYVTPLMASRRKTRAEEKYKKTAVDTYYGVQSAVAGFKEEGRLPGEYGNIILDEVTVMQVSDDQHWVSGSESGKYEAVYMTDGLGTLVYYSFRDGERASTWSGPSDDQAFTESHGGWSGGQGAGWTGYPVFKG